MIRGISGVPEGIISIIQGGRSGSIMDVVRRGNGDMSFGGGPPPPEKRAKQELRRGFAPQNNSSRRLIPASYCFGMESLALMAGLTASLLILPLILPPLPPPPPFMLLLVPIGILVVLMVLAFMPTPNSKHVTCSSYS